MATEKQVHANRQNAAKSTGPRTEKGKAASSQNALKHGLLARGVLFPGEDPAEFEAHLAAIEDAIQPGDALEQELVRQMADAQWRMRRLARLESGYLAAAVEKSRRAAKLYNLTEYLKPGYDGETVLLGYAIGGSTQELVHLARYDAHLGRRFERAIQQIARLRDAREKRQAPANPANNPVNRPATPSNGRNPHPTNGPFPKLARSPKPNSSSSEENSHTNLISPNHNEMNELKPTTRPPSHPAPPRSKPPTPQPGPMESHATQPPAASSGTNRVHPPAPDRN